jgi:chromosome partitioning protein
MAPATRVIVFASQKGGSGKTTLAGHLAVQAARMDYGPVALIDTDPQGSLSKWWNVRDTDEPAFVQSVFSNLFADIEEARADGFRLLVIDTPPAVTRAITEVVAHADLVILPTRPSPHDLRAVGATVDIVEAKKKPMIFVVNAATARARITSEAAVALSQHGTVAPVNIHHRVDFAASMIDGRTVMETNAKGRSAKEIELLWEYVADRLARLDEPAQSTIEDSARLSDPANFNALGRSAPSFGRRASGGDSM